MGRINRHRQGIFFKRQKESSKETKITFDQIVGRYSCSFRIFRSTSSSYLNIVILVLNAVLSTLFLGIQKNYGLMIKNLQTSNFFESIVIKKQKPKIEGNKKQFLI